MSDRRCIKLDEMRQPGMRRILDAMRQIEEEAPGLLDEALAASMVLAKQRGDGRLPQ
jgi:hypothetical protein